MTDHLVTFAQELRRLRGHMTVRELANLANCSKTHLSDLENGRRSATPSIARGLDKALGAGGRLVHLAEAGRPRLSADDTASSQAVNALLQEWDHVRRRDFFKATGAASAALAGAGHLGSTTHGGRDLMDAHTALRAAHGRLDNLSGASSVYSQAVEHHRQITDWYSTVQHPADRRQLAALAADTGGFVAFLSYDLGMPDRALTLFRDAVGFANQAGDLSSCTYQLGQMSRILSDQNQPHDALQLTDRALNIAGSRAHPAVRSWLHAVRAHHHATLGSVDPSQVDLGTAWDLLHLADDGEKPTYVGYLSEAELGKWTGHAMARLGQSNPALLARGRAALDEALTVWPTAMARGSAEVLVASARVEAASGEHESAAALVSRAVTIATKTGSARNLDAALDCRSRLAD